jgi:tRNA threonylcarbamoyladenosine biosynthesis protein TsaB
VRLLALDTATELCSVALLDDDRLLHREERIGRGHAEHLLPMVDALLREAGIGPTALDALAVGRGPGTFTGVRIAVSIAQGLALAAGLKVVPVSDLAALALAAHERSPGRAVLACLDARMGEVYWALYPPLALAADGTAILDAPEHLSPPGQVGPAGVELTVAGPGWAAYPALADRLPGVRLALPELLPSAREIARLGAAGLRDGRAVDPADLLPVYLRDEVATPSLRPPGGPRR